MQDFCALNNTYKVSMQINETKNEDLMQCFLNQINSNKSNEKYDLVEKFFKLNCQSLSDYFTKIISI